MNDKILTQILDTLRNTPLDTAEAFEFALQSLAWAKLSANGAISEPLRLTSALLGDPASAKEALISLGKGDEPWQAAFANTNPLERLTPAQMSPVLDLALRFAETGVLQAYDPADAITLQLGARGGAFGLPPEVAALLAGLTGIKTGDSAYTPWDTGAQLATRAARCGASVYLETPLQSVIPALIGILAEQSLQIVHADPIRHPSAIENGKPRLFDVALAAPPFGLRYDLNVADRDLFNRFPERTASGAVLTLRHLLAQTRRRIVVAVTNSVLFSGGGELSMRRDLLKRGIVEAVIALPSGLFETTNIPFAVLILDPSGGHRQVRFIDADRPQFRERKSKAKAELANLEQLIRQALEGETAENVAIVPVADILANDAQLQVGRYVLPDTMKQLQARLASAETTALGDLVTTIRPLPPVPDNTDDEDGIEAFEVGAADLPDHGYIVTPKRPVKVPNRIEQFLKPHDIVLIVKGSVGKLGIVPPNVPAPGNGGWVAGQSAIVLRGQPGSRIDPLTLALQLRSPLGQELLSGIVSGATIRLIQLKELTRLQVLVPDQETTRRAIEAFKTEVRLQEEIDRLREQQLLACAHMWTLD